MIFVLVKMAMSPSSQGRGGFENNLGNEFLKSYDDDIEKAKLTYFKRLKGDGNIDAT